MKKIEKVDDLITDNRNANSGTIRGRAMVEESFARYGAGRSVLADKNGRLIAGNTSKQGFISSGGKDVIVVESDGSKLVVVQRTDLDLETDDAARELAHVDNRSNQVGYNPDVNLIDEDIFNGADLGWMFREDELELLRSVTPEDDEDDDGELNGDKVIDADKVPRNASTFELVLVFESEQELRTARRRLQDEGYYTKS